MDYYSHKIAVRPLPGKGFGTVAVEPIQAGELIIAETPLLVISEWSPTYLLNAFNNLSTQNQSELLVLANSQKGPMHHLVGIALTNMLPLAQAGAYGIFKNVSRINHDCLPNCNHYQVGK